MSHRRCLEFHEERRRAFEDPNHTTKWFISAVEVCIRGHNRFYLGTDLSKPTGCAECGREISQNLTKVRRKENPNQKKQRTPAEKLEYLKLKLECEAGPIKSLQEAISDGDTMYFPNKPCKYGHISAKRIPGSRCLTCHLDPPSAELQEVTEQKWLAGAEERRAKKIAAERRAAIKYRVNMSDEKKEAFRVKRNSDSRRKVEEETKEERDVRLRKRRERRSDPILQAKEKVYREALSPEKKAHARKLERARYKKKGNAKNKQKRQEGNARLGRLHIRKRAKIWKAKNKSKHLAQAQQKRNTPVGRLKDSCNTVAHTLARYWNDERIPRSRRINLLDYTPKEFYLRLEETLPEGMTMEQAGEKHWHIDHYVPLGLIGKNIKDEDTAFQYAQDLKNLHYVSGAKNMKKNKWLDWEDDQEVVAEYLCQKHLDQEEGRRFMETFRCEKHTHMEKHV